MNSSVYLVPESVHAKHAHSSGELHKKRSVTDELNLLYEQIKKTPSYSNLFGWKQLVLGFSFNPSRSSFWFFNWVTMRS